MTAIHHMLIPLPLGIWTVAALLMFLAARGKPDWAQRALQPLLLLGLISGLAAAISGFLSWDFQALLSSPMSRNKIVLAVWSLSWWGMLWALHTIHGPKLYQPGRALVMVVLGIIGLGLAALTGFLGGQLAGVSSQLTELIHVLGFEIYTTIRLPAWTLIVLLGIVAGWFVLARRQPATR